jgi:serine/threonine protein kinase
MTDSLGDDISIISTLPPRWENWHDKGSHIDFSSHEQPQLQEVRYLGRGASAIVYETRCKGIALACKKIYCRNRVEVNKYKSGAEIEILKKLEHHHIVKLIGTYTHQNVMGLLLWPVAVCDLATLFKDLDGLKTPPHDGRLDSEVEERFFKLGIQTESSSVAVRFAQRRLFQSFPCLTGAIAYLHSQKIRHKDLKPSNVLLFDDNILLTDFGISTDFSDLTRSETDHGIRGTSRYFAPEVAPYLPYGRKADIFSLGCIFLEIFWASKTESIMEDFKAVLLADDDCSFHANLQNIRTWCDGEHGHSNAVRRLLIEIKYMMSQSPEDRPSAREIEQFFAVADGLRGPDDWPLYAPCCAPLTQQNALLEHERESFRASFRVDESTSLSGSTANPKVESNLPRGDILERLGIRRASSKTSIASSTLSNPYKGMKKKPEPYTAHMLRVQPKVQTTARKDIDEPISAIRKKLSLFSRR